MLFRSDEDKDRYNTVAGLFLSLLGRLPSVGEKVDCAGWTLQVLALDGRRIDRLRATSTQRADPDQGQMPAA